MRATQGCKLCLVDQRMVKRDLISASEIKLSFTKPAEPRMRKLQNGEGAVEMLDWARALFALIATLALIGLAAYAARRFGMLQGAGAQAPRRLKIIESLMLDPRRRLVVVRFGQRDHVLLLSPAGDHVVAEGAAHDPAPEETPS